MSPQNEKIKDPFENPRKSSSRHSNYYVPLFPVQTVYLTIHNLLCAGDFFSAFIFRPHIVSRNLQPAIPTPLKNVIKNGSTLLLPQGHSFMTWSVGFIFTFRTRKKMYKKAKANLKEFINKRVPQCRQTWYSIKVMCQKVFLQILYQNYLRNLIPPSVKS